MAIFENVTRVVARDCVVDEKLNRVIFAVDPPYMTLAIGKNGRKVKMLKQVLNRNIELVSFIDNPVEFIKRNLAPCEIRDVRIQERPNGRKIAIVAVRPQDKAMAIGKGGKTLEKIRMLVKRYFSIDNVIIA